MTKVVCQCLQLPAMGLGDVRWHYSNNLTFRTQPTVASSQKSALQPLALWTQPMGPQAGRPQVVHQHLQHRPGSLRVQQEWWLLGWRNPDSPSNSFLFYRNLCAMCWQMILNELLLVWGLRNGCKVTVARMPHLSIIEFVRGTRNCEHIISTCVSSKDTYSVFAQGCKMERKPK